ncbi:MAG: tetratricopeptide repeat protein [Desulfobacterales bacterium]|nr:tetratricopeptide repeat protein [Desulfobacterales bacterium]
MVRNFIFFTFLLTILFSIYSNTFTASWHLDDRPNIVNNYYLHIDSLHPNSLVKTFFTDTHNPETLGDRPYRPFACLTFALNWYFGQDNVFGYHIVNTIIHVLTAFFLYLLILKLFSTPNLRDNHIGTPFFIALLASIFWSVNPIQTQAVTYIVQRMAQLAAMFYLLGMLSYINARLSLKFSRRLIWLSFCLIFYLLGISSKQNAVMMPMALILLEIAFFQDIAEHITRKKVYLTTAVIAAIIFLAGSAAFIKGGPLSFTDYLYRIRPFTLSERLLTQPRVISLYLSQIFYPKPDRLSVAHDVVVSESLFAPWTTLPSILFISFLILISVFQLKKRPILSFSILFFFLNHIIESSIIGLEMIFEHRNYLPSLFLFLPIAYLFNYLLVTYKKNIIISISTSLLIFMLVIFFSADTYIRNQAWKNDITLWRDAVNKAPNDARALNILAIKLAWGDNSRHPHRYDMALKLLKESLNKNLPSNYVEADIYGNMALLYYYKKQNPAKANELFAKALEINPGNLKIRRDFANALILQKKFDDALTHVSMLLSKSPNNGIYHNLKGHIQLWQGKYSEALSSFKKAYDLVWDKASVILNTSVALSRSGQHDEAEKLLLHAIEHDSDTLTFYFAIIENSIRAGENKHACKYSERVANQFNAQKIKKGLETYADNPEYAPISKKIIEPVILQVLKKHHKPAS